MQLLGPLLMQPNNEKKEKKTKETQRKEKKRKEKKRKEKEDNTARGTSYLLGKKCLVQLR